MSATNRGAKRHPQDFYETPSWCVEALLPELRFHVEDVIDPCCGNGAILKALFKYWPNGPLQLQGIEIDSDRAKSATEWTQRSGPPSCVIQCGDFLSSPAPRCAPRCGVDCVITNPPYSFAEQFVRRAHLWVKPSGCIIMLLRLAFIASQNRKALFEDHPIDHIYVLPRRPSFSGDGKSDASDYGWFQWRPMRTRVDTTISRLRIP